MSTHPMIRLAAHVGAEDFPSLHAWSIGDLDRFWMEATSVCGVEWMSRPLQALPVAAMPAVEWFPGGTVNLGELAIRRAAVAPDEIAVVEQSQTRPTRETTWLELRDLVARCASGLARLGVGPGVRVASYLPNITETVVAFLATARLGGVWSSCAPEFGVTAVVDRFAQFQPHVLLHVDGYRYGAKTIDRRADAETIIAALATLRHAVPVRYLGSGDDGWNGLTNAGGASPEPFPAGYADPLYVLYSSGTTGLPKPIVHSHVGIVAEHLKTLTLHHGLGPGERFFWFTTTGWMMWNYLVSGLMTGSSIVLFDGDPAADNLLALWNVAYDHDVTMFGASAPFFMNCRKAGVRPPIGRLRELGSTGAPLPAEGFDYLADVAGSAVLVNSISGGTDVCSAFLGMNPLTATTRGEISGPMLGCDVQAFRPDGTQCSPGETGELVLTTPMPSMPLGFLGDDDGSRYHSAYFARFPGVWHHGDWLTFTESGGCVVSGRSDATLNRGGVRLGTADFYSVVEGLDAVVDSLVVHLTDRGADDLRLFVRLQPGVELGDELVATIRTRLRTELSPRHVPDSVEAVPMVPRTLSGKKLEVPVKKILAGADPQAVLSKESLVEPAAIDWFVALAERLRRAQ